MKIAFDREKDRRNRALRGVSLALGLDVLLGCVAEAFDERRDYGEERRIAYGLVNGRLFVCVYTRRDDIYRITSVRKANRREQARYAQR